MTPAASLVIGVLGFLLAWAWHNSGRVGDAVWSTPPNWLRRLLRLRMGPLYPSTIAFEVWSLLMVVSGAVAIVVDLNAPTERLLLNGSFYLIVVVGLLWGALALRAFVRRL